MSNQALILSFEQIEGDVTGICVELKKMFVGDASLPSEESAQLKNDINYAVGAHEEYPNQFDFVWFAKKIALAYKYRAGQIEDWKYKKKIIELAKKIYFDNSEEKSIVKRLEKISRKKEALKIVKNIETQCKQLVMVAKLIDPLRTKLIKRSKKIADHISSFNWQSELRFVNQVDIELVHIGQTGLELVESIYSEEAMADHLIKDFKKQLVK
ncbi:MAG: hypothetical protein ABIC04_00200 [Nanoarchaeota archaeon]